jgi:hypothetical protein
VKEEQSLSCSCQNNSVEIFGSIAPIAVRFTSINKTEHAGMEEWLWQLKELLLRCMVATARLQEGPLLTTGKAYEVP